MDISRHLVHTNVCRLLCRPLAPPSSPPPPPRRLSFGITWVGKPALTQAAKHPWRQAKVRRTRGCETQAGHTHSPAAVVVAVRRRGLATRSARSHRAPFGGARMPAVPVGAVPTRIHTVLPVNTAYPGPSSSD